MKINVKSCARCGNNHDKLPFELLNNPTDEFNHWGMCPKTNQPILLAIMQSSK